MWQYLFVGLAVAASAVYVARTLGPRSWRRKRGAQGGVVPGGGAGDAGDGCSNCSPAQKRSVHSVRQTGP
jgi:hypothetical protein